MRVVVVAHDNDGALAIVKHLARNRPQDEFFVVHTTGLYYERSYLESLWRMATRSSLLFVLRRSLDLLVYRLSSDNLAGVCKKLRIEVHKSADVNSRKTLAWIQGCSPDVVVSTFTMHILRSEVISLPTVAAIGVHPSVLPHYRGLEVFFWMLANQEATSGTSVFLLEPRVDTGRVFVQETYPIEPKETVNSLYEKLTESVCRLLAEALTQLEAPETIKYIPSTGAGSYYPMPTRQAYVRFRASGHRWK